MLQDGEIDEKLFAESCGEIGCQDSVRVLNVILKHFPATSVEVASPVAKFLAKQLLTACRTGHVRIVEALIQQWSAEKPELRDFLLTLQWGPDGTTPSAEAAKAGAVDVFCLVLNAAPDPSLYLETGLTTAIKHDECGIVEVCIKQGPEQGPKLLEKADSNNHTPLLQAALGLSFNTVNCLLELGANIHTTDESDRGAIFLAVLDLAPDVAPPRDRTEVLAKRKNIIRSLFERGARIDSRDANKQTALFLAVRNGFVDEVKCLLDLGANSRAQDITGRTPLFEVFDFDRDWTSLSHCRDMSLILNALLDSGAEPERIDDDGYTAASRAYVSISNSRSISNLEAELLKPYDSLEGFRSKSGTREALLLIMDMFVRRSTNKSSNP